MKKITHAITPFVLTGLLLFACKKGTIPTFTTPASIYFTAAAPYKGTQSKDSTGIGFGYSPVTVTDSIARISVSVLGQPSSADRVYKVVVDPLSTAKAGVHYDLPASPIIHAGRTIDSLRITFHRTPDLLNNPVTLILHLEPNENFKTDMKSDTLDAMTGKAADYTTFKVSVVDGLQKPSIWNNYPRYLFGTFSVKKLMLLNSVTGMPLDALNSYATIGFWDYWATMMNRYLLDQAAAGNTILEDDGTPMKMGIRVTG